MDLSSSLSGPKEFRLVKRGYDPDEVDAFLDQVAVSVEDLKRRLADASTSTAAPSSAETDPRGDEIQRALILAQRAADEALRQAHEEGGRISADARTQSERMLAEAEGEVARRRDEGRSGLLAEIRDLEVLREALSNDIVVLERHVDEQREGLQAAIGELQGLLDHPEVFRVAPPGELSDISLPDEEAVAPPAVVATPPVAPPPPAAESAADPDAASRPWLPPADVAEMGGPVEAPTRPVADTGGPSTQAVDLTVPRDEADRLDDDDAFLAELRKAMTDDEPLGPAAETDSPPTTAEADRARRGFGRRRQA